MPSPDDARPVEYIGGPLRRLFMRYPWHVSAVVGVLIITGLRPYTRHVPEAPPIIAPMPAFELSTATGEVIRTDDLLGSVWLAGFVCHGCTGPIANTGSTLRDIALRSITHGKPIRFLAIATDSVRDSAETMGQWAASHSLPTDRWTNATGAQPVITGLRAEVIRAFKSDTPETWARLFIIDERAQLRGAYALGDRGADEAYHRAQHVAREARIRAISAEKSP